jgi:uncharacterized protein (TIGR01777 family)
MRIICGATGLIGRRLVAHWLKQGHAMTVISRSPRDAATMFHSRVQALAWDKLAEETLRSAEVVVNLAGAGVAERRWTTSRKQEILSSRVNTTQKIASLLAALNGAAPPLLNASAIGIYGLQEQVPRGLPPRYDEDHVIDWDKAPDFLSKVGRRWERAAQVAINSGVRVVLMRFGVVLAREGGALPQLVTPFKFYLGGPIGTGYQPFSWVAIDDVIRVIDFLLTQPKLIGPVNVVAPECVTEGVIAETIGQVLHKPTALTAPEFAFKMMFGEMARELLLEGQYVYPKRLIEAGFCFAYPDIKSALNHILG